MKIDNARYELKLLRNIFFGEKKSHFQEFFHVKKFKLNFRRKLEKFL